MMGFTAKIFAFPFLGVLLAAVPAPLTAPASGSAKVAAEAPPSERDAVRFFGMRRQPIFFDDTLAALMHQGVSER